MKLTTWIAIITLAAVFAATPKRSLSQDSEPAILSVISELDQPFLFSYLSWDKKVQVRDGRAILSDVNNQGGAGFNQNLDLSTFANASPALLVKINPANQAKVLKLMLLDGEDHQATWQFELPASDAQWQWLTPQAGASLDQPNATNKEKPGTFRLNLVTQWQLQGDWVGGVALDVEVDRIVVVSPNASMQAMKLEQQQRLDEAAKQLKQQHDGLQKKYATRSERSPQVERVSLVAPNVLALTIQAGKLTPSELIPYRAEPNDKLREVKNEGGEVEQLLLERRGNTIGWLIGDQRNWLTTYERIDGEPLLDFLADDPATYTLESIDQSATAKGIKPLAVHRKSRVSHWAQGPGELALHHTLYLKLPQNIPHRSKWKLMLGDLNTQQRDVEFNFDVSHVRSDAIHVQQIGYRPDDPIKRAFVSCWLGNGGVLPQPDVVRFLLIDDATGKHVYTGQGQRHFPADQPELMAREANFNGTDVARLDFSDFKQPGKYLLVVEGVGCSYPFEIGRDVWTAAWRTQLRGLYNNRSGIELGPPYTNFKKPRDMHPDDGYKVTRSTYRAVEKGAEAYADVAAGDTGEAVPSGWGGYHDAGDWNPRRVTHMRVTLAMLELFDQYESKLKSFQLGIPPTDGLPDMLTESVFEFSCFRRLQQPDGGIPFEMESKGDPLVGEVSWLNSFGSLVLAADYAGSWCYAGVGGRLSRLLEPYDASLAKDYRDSAVKAFAFAEQDFAKDKAAGKTASRENTWQAIDDRNLAALELYRLTGDQDYHELFLQDSVLTEDQPNLFQYGTHVQRDHAFHYARLPVGLGDQGLKKKAISAIVEQAERALHYADGNAFNLTTCDKGKPQFIGFYTTPDAADLTRAHFLTGEVKYLAGAVQATQFQAGCNPNNLVYTTGIGANPVKNVFKLDARRTGQAVPEGLTPYGNIDFGKWNHNGITWPITWYLGKVTVPDPYAWPTHEAYWDLGAWPMLEEFTVDAWTPNVLVWGYLALRKES